jgi:hypothetical protein
MSRRLTTTRSSRPASIPWPGAAAFLVFAAILAGAGSASAQRLYGCDSTGRLFTIDLVTGAGTHVCDLPVHPDPGATEMEFDDASGMAFVQARDGIFSGQLFDILSCSALGAPVPTDDLVMNGLEYIGGILYGTAIPYSCEPSDLVTVDPMTGAVTPIGPTGLGPISGLAWDDATSTMYGVTGCYQQFGPSQLVTIDITTGLATPVGPTGHFLGSLEVGPGGILYAAGNRIDGGNLYAIDPATGLATLVGPTGFVDVTGLALVSRWPSIQCPPDVVVPSYSTLPTLTLDGFRITNAGTIPGTFEYSVSATGVAALSDGGDPAALSGTTPLLAPGASFEPPDAVLIVPPILQLEEEFVTYRVSVNEPGHGISCATVVRFEPPVPVFITAFEAVAREAGVDLTWQIVSDEEIRGFKIYRSGTGGTGNEEVSPPGLIPAPSRSYTDESARGGATYQYALAVVTADGSELVSLGARVTTLQRPLELHQNAPNPFNPVTAISFTLPARSRVSLAVYDVRGKLVRTLADEMMDEGRHERLWDGRNAAGSPASSGVYFYTMKAGGATLTKKMLLLK